MLLLTTIAFVCGALLAGSAERWRSRTRPRQEGTEPPASTGADPATPAGVAGEDAGTAGWRERCVQLQLSEEYVAAQTRQIIEEYSMLMTMALIAASDQTEALRTATESAVDSFGTAQATTRSVVAEASAAENLLLALTESLTKVEGMAEFIAGVANRTNLLSLNATIEAARVGEAGRGFGVVAREVKELARSTTQSTIDISTTVEQLRHEVSAVVAALRQMTEGVSSIDSAAATVADVMGSQRTALEELDMHVSDVTAQMDLLSMLVMGMDRSDHRRVAADGAITLDLGGSTIETSLLDLTPTGLECSILTSTALATGDRVGVTLPLPDDALELTAVVRSRVGAQGRDHLRLDFSDLPDHQAAAIMHYLSTLTDLVGAG